MDPFLRLFFRPEQVATRYSSSCFGVVSFGKNSAIPQIVLTRLVSRVTNARLNAVSRCDSLTARTVVSGHVVYPKNKPGRCFAFMAAQRQTLTSLHFTRRVLQRIVVAILCSQTETIVGLLDTAGEGGVAAMYQVNADADSCSNANSHSDDGSFTAGAIRLLRCRAEERQVEPA